MFVTHQAHGDESESHRHAGVSPATTGFDPPHRYASSGRTHYYAGSSIRGGFTSVRGIMQEGSSLPVCRLRSRVDELAGFLANLNEKYPDDCGFEAAALFGDGSWCGQVRCGSSVFGPT